MSEHNPDSAATPEEPAEDSPAEVFENRAARRKKGKTSAPPQVFAKGQPPAGRGSVQNPRQYGSRRSG